MKKFALLLVSVSLIRIISATEPELSPQPPVLIAPPDSSINIPLSITLDWNAVGTITYYQLEVDTTLSFNSPWKVSVTLPFISFVNNGPDTQYQLSSLTYSTTYFWRVRTSTGATTSNWSTEWRFTTMSGTFSVNEFPLFENISVSPIPSKDKITVRFPKTISEKVSVKLFDVTGKVLFSDVFENTNIYSFGTEVLASGFYFVSFVSENQKRTIKVVVQ